MTTGSYNEGNREAEKRERNKALPVGGMFTMICAKCKQSKLIARGRVRLKPKRHLICRECLEKENV
jgi:hypothetical protein